MGLLDLLFGGGSKPQPVMQKQSEPAAVVKPAVIDIHPETAGVATMMSAQLNPEIVAAIVASISCVMETSVGAELSAITAAVVHRGGGEYTSSAWALTGRQKLMDVRQFV